MRYLSLVLLLVVFSGCGINTSEPPTTTFAIIGDRTGLHVNDIDGVDTMMRDIGDVPAFVTGPGGAACGGCHRAALIKADDASGLTSFYQHKSANGYLVEDGGDGSGVWEDVVEEIMEFFAN